MCMNTSSASFFLELKHPDCSLAATDACICAIHLTQDVLRPVRGMGHEAYIEPPQLGEMCTLTHKTCTDHTCIIFTLKILG